LPNDIKIDSYHFELYRFTVGAFFSETVYTPSAFNSRLKTHLFHKFFPS